MMKNKDTYAVAVREEDTGEIRVETHETKRNSFVKAAQKVPIVRGVVNFVESLVVGIRTLLISASYEEEDKETGELQRKELTDSKGMVFGTVAFSIIVAVVVFMLAPYWLSLLFEKFIASVTVLALIEGFIRVVIFLGYIWIIARTEDIKRVFMYHGAEHKCINCLEHGNELTVENVRNSSRFHKRCGTSFLLIVMVISILVFACIRVDSGVWRFLLRIILIPVVAGISYEFIRLAGRSDNKLVNFLSRPGLALQRLTTKEPDDSMIEVGIASVEAVFDWKEFLKEFRRGTVIDS